MANSVRRRLSQLARIPVEELKTVGPKKSVALAKMNIHWVLDLLFFYPRKWNDRPVAIQKPRPFAWIFGCSGALASKVSAAATHQRRAAEGRWRGLAWASAPDRRGHLG